jgi:hypothetical protein
MKDKLEAIEGKDILEKTKVLLKEHIENDYLSLIKFTEFMLDFAIKNGEVFKIFNPIKLCDFII